MADRYLLAFVKNAVGATGTNPQEQTALENLLCQRLLTAGLTVSATGVITTTVPISPGTGGGLNPLDYGAVGNGTTNDTVALQATIDATPATGGAVLLPATGTFLSGNLNVTNRTNFTLRSLGATIQWTGTAAANNYIGIQLVGTLTNCTFEDLILVGDAVTANGHAGIWNLSGPTLTNIAMRRNRVSSVVFGLGLSADGSGSIQGLEISGNYLDTIVGTVAGVGYGIYHASSSTTAAHVRILNNEISRAQRHSIYQGKGVGVVIGQNVIRLHRTGQGVPGSPLPAIEVARTQTCTVIGNVIDTAQDGGIEVAPGGGTSSKDVVVVGNVLSNGSGVATGISVGTSDPLTNGATSQVLVSGNVIATTGVSNPQIYLWEGTRITIVGNSCHMLAVPGTATSLYFAASLETAGTSTYTNDVLVKDNLFYGTNNGGTYIPVEFSALMAASGARADFVSNRVAGPGNAFVLDGAQTNANVHVLWQPATGLTTVAGESIAAALTLTAALVSTAITASGIVTANLAAGGGFVINNPTADAGVTGQAYTTLQTAGASRWFYGMSAGGNTGNWDVYNNITAGLSLTIDKTSHLVTTLAGLKVGTGFGCNTKAAQTAVASGGALNAYGAGANGFDTAGNASALYAMVVAIRGALVANGILS